MGGPNSQTKAVIVGYPKGHTLPAYVIICGQRFRVQTYIPCPKRCTNCQAFGHLGRDCPNPQMLPLRQGHNRDKCGNIEKPKCTNCGGPHSAAYRECPKYKVVKEALKIRAVEGLSYAAALRKGIDALNAAEADSTGEAESIPPTQPQAPT